jgi:hypothetical protein
VVLVVVVLVVVVVGATREGMRARSWALALRFSGL